jgi:hypothetical protein
MDCFFAVFLPFLDVPAVLIADRGNRESDDDVASHFPGSDPSESNIVLE